MHFSDIIGNLGSNYSWSYFWFLHWQKFHLQTLATLLNFFFWSVDYANLVYNLFISFWKCQDTQTFFILEGILYWHIQKDFFRQFAAFLILFGQKNCISWVSKFNNFFLTCTERFIFEGFNIVLYGKFIFNSAIPFSLFFVWSVNCFENFPCATRMSKLLQVCLITYVQFVIVEHCWPFPRNLLMEC